MDMGDIPLWRLWCGMGREDGRWELQVEMKEMRKEKGFKFKEIGEEVKEIVEVGAGIYLGIRYSGMQCVRYLARTWGRLCRVPTVLRRRATAPATTVFI